MDILRSNPSLCSHIEMETYTWEVMPPEMKNRNVVDQLVAEYDWTLQQLTERGLERRISPETTFGINPSVRLLFSGHLLS